ncbi:hypothetical protein J5X84_45015 [Streptosporangiaceae bacterium NEAU-GS5]|nr:hypothetical protein [Streptosporangiaceae bacterium NEAU-GS5]
MSLRRIAACVLAGATLTAFGAAPAGAATVLAKPNPGGPSITSIDVVIGPVWSVGHRAKASGHVKAVETKNIAHPGETTSLIQVTGKLWDLDPGSKCAYFEIRAKFKGEGSPASVYKKCGTGNYQEIDFRVSKPLKHFDKLKFRVCQVGWHSTHPTKCGSWITPIHH